MKSTPRPTRPGLLRVEDDGSLKVIDELVPKSPGAGWISISYDLRKALIQTGDVLVQREVECGRSPLVSIALTSTGRFARANWPGKEES